MRELVAQHEAAVADVTRKEEAAVALSKLPRSTRNSAYLFEAMKAVERARTTRKDLAAKLAAALDAL